MKHVLNVVIKLVDNIRSRALNHREFREYLDSLQSNVLNCTKVRWPSAGRVFERVWNLKDEIMSLMGKKGIDAYKRLKHNKLYLWPSFFRAYPNLYI